MKIMENKGEYIFVKYDEPYQLKNLIALMRKAAEMCVTENCEKLLVDLLDMPGTIKTLDRFELGIQGVRIFRHKAKIAVVYRKEELNLFAENVAVNRGMNARVLSNLEEAIKWLEVK